MPRYLAIDRGNTRDKACVWDVGGERLTAQDVEVGAIGSISFDAAVICDVGNRPPLGIDALEVCGDMPLPFETLYSTPQTLGADRIAAVAGALALNLSDALVMDAGTAVTYDVLENGVHMGGSIAPGVDMRLTALHEHTGRLPLPPTVVPEHTLGLTTEEALLTGTLLGIVGETAFRAENKDTVIVTGGDASLVMEAARRHCPGLFAKMRHEPRLVMRGLLEILLYNLEKNKDTDVTE